MERNDLRKSGMEFELQVLGSGSAIPSFGRFSSSQVLTTHGKSFMIDCADGTQFRMREMVINTSRLDHIFISHLHGDHCFGLMAVLSTLGMMNRTADMYIHSHGDLEKILKPHLDYFCKDLSYKVIFEPYRQNEHEVIYEDRTMTVETIPLVHSMPTSGFLFKEKPHEPHLDKELLKFYKVGIEQTKAIKEGADFIDEKGQVVSNKRFLRPASPSKSYAYCSDTYYSERIIPIIEGADVLFHESTFKEADIIRTKQTLHSTASQAATIAAKANVGKLLIGHFSARYGDLRPLLDEAKAIFPNCDLATDKSCWKW